MPSNNSLPLREKLLLGSLALVAAMLAMLVASPDADSVPPPTPKPGPVQHCPTGCNPLEWLLGPPPTPASTATTWQELLLPEGPL